MNPSASHVCRGVNAAPDAARTAGAEERLCALYSRTRFRLTLVESGLLVLFLAAISIGGPAHRLDEALDLLAPPGFAHTALYVFVTLLLVRAALLPLDWVTGYRL